MTQCIHCVFRSMSDVGYCLNATVSDCRESGLVPEETLQSIENDFKSMQEQYGIYCPPQQSGLPLSMITMKC